MTRTTVAVIAYRRPRALERLLEALEETTAEVVVVNVGDDPEVDAVARGAAVTTCVVPVENRGFAAAVNTAASVARGEVVVFTNDDATLSARGAEQLADVVLAGRADLAVPRIVDSDGRDEGTVLALPTPRRLLWEWLVLPDTPVRRLRDRVRVEKWRRPTATEPVDAARAVTVAVRADVLRETPLPEEYFLYWEELEWFWRLRERGRRLVMVPAVEVVHGGGRADVRPEKSRLLARNAVRCVRRTQGRAAALAAFVIVIAWNARLFLLDGLRSALSASEESAPRLAARRAGLEAALASWRELR
jgi:N-acetylglucosaminyl-diphospho-decaprenol L-rhamnosyltransferase